MEEPFGLEKPCEIRVAAFEWFPVCVIPSLVGFFPTLCLKTEGLSRFLCVGNPVAEHFGLGGEGGLASAPGTRS